MPLPDGFYMVGRTALGYLAASWTTNTTAAGGWQPTQYAQYWDPSSSEDVQRLRPLSHSALDFGGVAPDGAGLKNPRGPITAREITAGPLAGLYLLLYYNNACNGYTSTARNPYWLTVGRPAVRCAASCLYAISQNNDGRCHMIDCEIGEWTKASVGTARDRTVRYTA